MPSPTQQPTLRSITSETIITGATSLSVFAAVGTVTVTSSGNLTLPEGVGISLETSDTVMGSVTITPASGATALVTYFS